MKRFHLHGKGNRTRSRVSVMQDSRYKHLLDVAAELCLHFRGSCQCIDMHREVLHLPLCKTQNNNVAFAVQRTKMCWSCSRVCTYDHTSQVFD